MMNIDYLFFGKYYFLISSISIVVGTPSKDNRILSLKDSSRNHYNAIIPIPMIGSIIYQPVNKIKTPDATTPNDTKVSAIMCK